MTFNIYTWVMKPFFLTERDVVAFDHVAEGDLVADAVELFGFGVRVGDWAFGGRWGEGVSF